MRSIVIYALILSSFISSAQHTISGKVTDKQTGQPVTYALVSAGSIRTFTDQAGGFQIVANADDSVLHVVASFYQPEKIKIPVAEKILIELIPEEQNIEAVTVTAMRIESRLLNSTGPISLITGSQLSRNSGIAIEPALNQVPGLYMHSGSLNTNRISIRGIGSRTPYGTSKIKAYLDDIPLTSGDGETTLEDISLLAISQVEVVRGPASGIYGSGLGGAILLKTAPEQRP